MKNLVNNLTVYNYVPEHSPTVFPVVIHDENGAELLTYQTIDDTQLSTLMCDDISLQSLLKAGVDPSTMRVNTGDYSRLNNVISALGTVSDIVDNLLPLEPSEPENTNF